MPISDVPFARDFHDKPTFSIRCRWTISVRVIEAELWLG